MGKRFKRRVKAQKDLASHKRVLQEQIKRLADYTQGVLGQIGENLAGVMNVQELLVEKAGLTPEQVADWVEAKKKELSDKQDQELLKLEERRAAKAKELADNAEQEEITAHAAIEGMTNEEHEKWLAKREAAKELDREIAEHNAKVDAANAEKRAAKDPSPEPAETGPGGGPVQASGAAQG